MSTSLERWVVMLAVAVATGPVLAHHSLASYDTDTPIRLKGVIIRVERVNPHSLLFLDHQDGAGHTTRWALEGPGPVRLARMGLDKVQLEAGDVIEACGYATKAPVERRTNPESRGADSAASGPTAIAGRAFNAEMLVLADGSRIAWSDYGQHHCLGKAHTDIHTKSSGPRDVR